MRTDVKLGLVVSVVVVGFAGWYLMNFGGQEAPIQIDSDDVLSATDKPPAQQTTIAKSKRKHPNSRSGQSAKTSKPRRSGSSAERLARGNSRTPTDQGRSGRARPGEVKNDPTDLTNLFTADSSKNNRKNPTSAKNSRVVDSRSGGGKPAKALALTGRAATRRGEGAANMEQHTVKAGDTILKLARLYFGNTRYAKSILEANPQLTNPAELAIGTLINIPDADMAGPDTSHQSHAAARTPLVQQRSQPSSAARKNSAARNARQNRARATRTHKIVAGDTLYAIALEKLGEGSRWQEVYDLNKVVIGDDPGVLKLGTVITLPQK